MTEPRKNDCAHVFAGGVPICQLCGAKGVAETVGLAINQPDRRWFTCDICGQRHYNDEDGCMTRQEDG